MAADPTQPSLLSRLRDPDDQDSWEEFDRKYRDLILRYCRHCGLQQADAEDVRQIIMMNLSRSLRRFHYDRERGRFRGYLGRVVQNAIRRHQGGMGPAPDPVHSGIPEGEGWSADAEARWEKEWMLHHYRLAMQTVRRSFEPRSIAIFDRILKGQSTETVATAFDLTTQAVHKVKQRIRARLSELVATQIQDEEGF